MSSSKWGTAQWDQTKCWTTACKNSIEIGDTVIVHPNSGPGQSTVYACAPCGAKWGDYWGAGPNLNVKPTVLATNQTIIKVISFAYKFGEPSDGRVIDIRKHIRNPWKNPKLRKLNGLAPEVQEFVRQCKGTQVVINRAEVAESMGHKTIYIGCQGGKHRSVAVAEIAAAEFRAHGLLVEVSHRDLNRKKEKADGSHDNSGVSDSPEALSA